MQTLKHKRHISLWLPPLRCNSIAQIRILCSRPTSIRKKEIQKEVEKKKKKKTLFIFCKSENWETLFILCNNRQFRSNLENYSEGMDFIPLFVFYSITVYRVLKRLPFSLISNLFLQSLEFCLFDFCSLFGCFLLCLCFSYVSWI